MSIGSDNITDCNIICNPYYLMPLSCGTYCKGFMFVPSTPPSTVADQFQNNWWIILVGLGVLIVVVVIIVACCLKQKIRMFVQNCRVRRCRRLTRLDDVEKNVANENTSDSGISTDGQSMDTVVELQNGPGNNEVDRNATEDSSINPLLPRSALVIGQRSGTDFVSIQT